MRRRDPEILELLEGEPELLAIADAIAETQRPPKPHLLRRRVPQLVAVAAVAAVLLVVLLVLPGGKGPGVVGRALAAVGDGPVVHLVLQVPGDQATVDLQTGQRSIATAESEIWIDSRLKKLHAVTRFDGHVVGDMLLPDDGGSSDDFDAATADPAFTALFSGYRAALADGSATVEGKDRIDGRDVYWLRFAATARRQAAEVAVDASTYKPVVFRDHGSDVRVVLAETTGFDAHDFSRSGPDPESLVVHGTSSTEYSPVRSRHPVVTAPWLTAGNELDGLELTASNRMTVTTDGNTVHGRVLMYDPASAPPPDPQALPPEPALTVEELPRPDDPRAWTDVPSGSVVITQSETSSGGQGMHPLWTGKLVKDSVYVTIETDRSEDALIAAARALHPAP